MTEKELLIQIAAQNDVIMMILMDSVKDLEKKGFYESIYSQVKKDYEINVTD